MSGYKNTTVINSNHYKVNNLKKNTAGTVIKIHWTSTLGIIIPPAKRIGSMKTDMKL